jgi:hypothetical protein
MKTWDTSRVFCTSDITSPESTPTPQNPHVINMSYHMRPTNIIIKSNLVQTYSLNVIFLLFFQSDGHFHFPDLIRNRPP